MPILEVRCCCTPKKLLGWLPVSDRKCFRGAVLKYVPFEDATAEVSHCITLSVERIHVEGRSYLAVKSDDTPIETLRLIPSFKENT